MNAPCNHKRIIEGCKWCALAAKDPRYAALWGLPLPPKKKCGNCQPVTAVPHPPSFSARSVTWAYGVTTVPSRKDDLLPRTIASLRKGGFEQPRLFVDGVSAEEESWYGAAFALPLTPRRSPLKTAGNWVLALYELYYRQPGATYYALFQDDFVTYPNLRVYLEQNPCPPRGYMNLYTFPSNQSYCPCGYEGWFQSRPVDPRTPEWQTGRGAVALVFPREGVATLLSQRSLVDRVMTPEIKDRKIDGGIVNAMNMAGWREYVHAPSLVQHTGDKSSMGNLPHLKATSFLGENHNALNLRAVASGG